MTILLVGSAATTSAFERCGARAFLATSLLEVTEEQGLKVRDVIRLIQDDGWLQVRQRGSHRQFKHGIKPGLVTIAGKPGDDLAAGTLASVLKQAGLDEIPRRS